MASPLQQQSVQRKLVYIGLILALFFGAFLFRKYGVEAHAQQLALREQDRADVDLTGSAVRLSLTGSRGLAVCILWATAIDKQKKNQWNELELLVRSVTKLQPHWIQPWLFQSWNLAYNVSVESDRERDQYFYISRGIELLSEGERLNKNHPDLRSGVAHYTMNKIAQGDKKNVLMSLFTMSCMDPKERDPNRFRKTDERGRTSIDLIEFEKFCRKHPQLVRRLREQLRCNRPEAVVDFLARNEKLPSLFQDPRPDREQTPLKTDPGQRFPVLPPPRDNPWDAEALNHQSNIDEIIDYIDAYLVAHAWYSYAQEALPKPDPSMPGKDGPVTDRTKQRKPKMTTLLFRMSPARAQTYIAERLEQGGWFDTDGWAIDGPDANAAQKWFPHLDKMVVGGRYNWGVQFWTKAQEKWQRHGEQNRLLLSPTEEADLNRRARRFREFMKIAPTERTRQMRREELPGDLRDGYDAHEYLVELEYYVSLTNFRHFYHTSLVERQPETVAARKKFFEAERLRRRALRADALARYEEAIPAWKELLDKHPDFRKDSQVQEETYEVQLKYLELVKGIRGQDIKDGMVEQNFRTQIAASAGIQSLPALVLAAKLWSQPRLLPDPTLEGPFDGKDPNGELYVPLNTREVVRGRSPAARAAAAAAVNTTAPRQ